MLIWPGDGPNKDGNLPPEVWSLVDAQLTPIDSVLCHESGMGLIKRIGMNPKRTGQDRPLGSPETGRCPAASDADGTQQPSNGS